MVKLHPGPFVVAVAGAAVFAAGTVLSTVVLGRITDDVVLPTFETGEVPDGALRGGVLAIVAVTVLRVVGVVCRRFFAGMTSERVQMTLRHRLSDQYLALPLAWHQRVPAGQLLAHADNDAEVAVDVLHPLPFSLGVGFLAVFAAISIVAVDPLLASIAFLIFPALTALNRVYSSRIEKPAAEVQEGVGIVSSIAHESFDGALVVKTLGRSEHESRRFGAAVRELQANRVRVGFLRAAFESVMDVLPNLGIIVVLVIGIYRVDAGAVGPGDLVQVTALFTVLAFPMRVMGFFLESVPPSVVAHGRLEAVFDEPLPEPPPTYRRLPAGPLSLSASGVSFHYPGGPPVLDDVNLEVRPGEVVALVGSTGAGKSTLCNVLCGLLPLRSGVVRLGGVDIDDVDPIERTDNVALVFQESFLFADTLHANIDLTGRATPSEIHRVAEIARISQFVDGLPQRFDTVVGERGITLSGGQRQRVALARALIQSPRLLMLDDATSAVDARVEQQILARLRAELDTTTVIVAQRVSTIQLADRVLYMRDGTISASGTHAELLGHPGYAALVRAYEEAAR
ncbi:MAG: ABC transporter ATP-binding protein [Ilumatobacter sp.]|nr:ABC transporter ATP-binding protein [Ilumatobacter sp.]